MWEFLAVVENFEDLFDLKKMLINMTRIYVHGLKILIFQVDLFEKIFICDGDAKSERFFF